MKDQLAAGAGALKPGAIVQVAGYGFQFQARQLAQLPFRAIKGADGVAGLNELPRDMRTDEAGRAGDQSFHVIIFPQK